MNLLPNFLRRLGAKPTPTLSDAARVMGQRGRAKQLNAERNRIIDTANDMARRHGKPLIARRPV